jgi:hypothetical protein
MRALRRVSSRPPPGSHHSPTSPKTAGGGGGCRRIQGSTTGSELASAAPPPGSHHSPTSPKNCWGRLAVGRIGRLDESHRTAPYAAPPGSHHSPTSPKTAGGGGVADGSRARRITSNCARRGPLFPGPSPPLRGRKGRIRSRFRTGRRDALSGSRPKQRSRGPTLEPRLLIHCTFVLSYSRTFVLSYFRTLVPSYPYAICSWPTELSAVSSTGDSASATPWWASQRSASSAAMQPVPAAVMAWR